MDTSTATSLGDIGALTHELPASLQGREPVSLDGRRSTARRASSSPQFLVDRGMPTEVTSITREHVEAFMEHLLATRAPATASNRYRALKRFFGFLVEEGEITSNPMERMHPPKVPEAPMPCSPTISSAPC